MKKKSPRVLMIGVAPGESDGGSITIKNLFSQFDKADLAAIVPDVASTSGDISKYCRVYRLGRKERANSIFKFIQKSTDSGPSKINQTQTAPKNNKFIAYIKLFGHKILGVTGLNHLLKSYKLSPELEKWIEKFDPDVIYCQLAVVDMIRFVTKIHSKHKLPLIIHTMDDWPTTINRPNLLYLYWKWKIGHEFRLLVEKSSLLMGISDEMCQEYRKRYHRKFVSFHNPIDLKLWITRSKKNWSINAPAKLIYFGAINDFSNKVAIQDVAKTIHGINQDKINIVFDIFTYQFNIPVATKLNNLSGVNIHKNLPHKLMPETISKYDLCIIPINIDSLTTRFAKLSMPTKASECMISGVPTLVYAGKCTALYQNASRNKWAYPIGMRSNILLEKAILTMLSEKKLRVEIAQKAVKFAKNNFDIAKVSEDFKNHIVKIINR